MIPDRETKKLDLEILEFIKRSSHQPSSDDCFQVMAFKIFDYQFRRNLNYRKFCVFEKKRPGRLKTWKEIPAMPADGFKELVLTTFPVKNTVKVFKTSGTTQINRGAHFFDTLKLYEAAILPPFQKYLLSDSTDIIYHFLIHSPKEAPDSSLSHMMGVINRVFAKEKGRFYVLKNEILHARLLSDLRAAKNKVFMLATAFSLKSFLDHLKAEKVALKLPAGSRLMETGGFKGGASEVSKFVLYDECVQRLGIRRDCCVSEYGMTELSSQLYDATLRDKHQSGKQRLFRGPAWLKTLVIDPKTGKEVQYGKIGILRHFDLANRGSVMAVQTEDLGRAVGQGIELLGRASGAELRGCSLNYEEFLAFPSS